MNPVMWVLLIGNAWAISGYLTKDECIAASKDVRLEYIMQCVPMRAIGTVGHGR